MTNVNAENVSALALRVAAAVARVCVGTPASWSPLVNAAYVEAGASGATETTAKLRRALDEVDHYIASKR